MDDKVIKKVTYELAEEWLPEGNEYEDIYKTEVKNIAHEEKFNYLLKKDETHEKDVERKVLFYILAGNNDLFNKVDYIYDFKEHSINPECLESKEVDFCSSSRQLIKLAFNLYNGFPADVLGTFKHLDESNFTLALNAIKMRFKFKVIPKLLWCKIMV